MRVAPWVGVLLVAAGLGPARSGAEGGVFTAQTPTLAEPPAARETLLARKAYELPIEALAAYREGLRAADSGDPARAAAFFEEAALLDPGFPEAHLALARLHLLQDPRQALEDLRRAGDAALATFGSQHLLVVNAAFGGAILITLAFAVFLAYLAVQLLPRVHHSVAEHLQLRFSSRISRALGLALLVMPMFWGLGWLPFLLVWAGLQWPWLRRGERAWVVAFGLPVMAAPLALWFASPWLYAPLDPAGRPFLLSRAMASPATPGMERALERELAENPADAEMAFALALVQERAGKLGPAAATYARASKLGAAEDAVLNNLGVVAFLQDDYDRALGHFQRAVEANPAEAAARFNLSQAYAKKLYFEKADQELAAANRLDIGRVRAALRRSNDDPKRVMIDVLLAPAALWSAAAEAPRRMPTLPGWLAFLFPGALWLFPVVGTAGFIAGTLVGRRLHRNLPSFPCSNCGASVCRRCLRRIRHEAYCGACGEALLRIQSASYSKLVLDARIRRKRRSSSIFARIAELLLPGLGALRRGKAGGTAVVVLLAVGAGLGLLRGGVAVSRMVWIDGERGPWWPEFPLALLVVCFAISVLAQSLGRGPGLHHKGFFAGKHASEISDRVERAA